MTHLEMNEIKEAVHRGTAGYYFDIPRATIDMIRSDVMSEIMDAECKKVDTEYAELTSEDIEMANEAMKRR